MVALVELVEVTAARNLLDLVRDLNHLLLLEEVLGEPADFIDPFRGSLLDFPDCLLVVLDVVVCPRLRAEFNHNHIVSRHDLVLVEIVFHDPYDCFQVGVSESVLIYELIEIYEVIGFRNEYLD